MDKQIKLLVVDDENGIINLLKYAFGQKGWEIYTASNAEQGLKIYSENNYDIVLTDMHMPGQNGLEFIKEIKSKNSKQTIILFSSHSEKSSELEAEAKDLDIFDCIFKPFSIDKIMFAVEMALEGKDGVKPELPAEAPKQAEEQAEDQEQPQAAEKKNENEGSRRTAKILVVDDEAGVRTLLLYELKMYGYKVEAVENGLEAVERIKKEKFDLVISDIKMPKLDGVQTLEKIKEIDPDVEVIMATGFGTIETAVQSMKKGAYDYISKPFNIDEILMLIEKALEKHEIKVLLGIYESSKAIFSTVNLEQLLEIITDILSKTLRIDEMLIFLYKQDVKLELAASYGLADPAARKDRTAMFEPASEILLKDSTPMLFPPQPSYKSFEDIKLDNKITACAVYPLEIKNKNLGMLCLSRISKEDIFNTEDLRTISIFVSQISQAIENAKLYDILEKKVDELKQAYNKLDYQKDQLIQKEKLSAIGRLARGVAHELNNPLTVVMGTLELIFDGTIGKNEVTNKLRGVYKQAERCRHIVQNLLLFSRQSSPVKELCDISVLIEEVLELLNYEITSKKISVKKDFTKSIPKVMIDPDQIRQVFLNIIINAVHFIEQKGSAGEISIQIKPRQDTLVCGIKDNGIGMSADELKNIFDPFFTTKDVQQGIGLGLSLCYGIMKEHNGSIKVESKKGQGSVFSAEFPMSEQGKA